MPGVSTGLESMRIDRLVILHIGRGRRGTSERVAEVAAPAIVCESETVADSVVGISGRQPESDPTETPVALSKRTDGDVGASVLRQT